MTSGALSLTLRFVGPRPLGDLLGYDRHRHRPQHRPHAKPDHAP